MSGLVVAVIIVVAACAVIGPALALLTMRRDAPPKKPQGGWQKWKDDD